MLDHYRYLISTSKWCDNLKIPKRNTELFKKSVRYSRPINGTNCLFQYPMSQVYMYLKLKVKLHSELTEETNILAS